MAFCHYFSTTCYFSFSTVCFLQSASDLNVAKLVVTFHHKTYRLLHHRRRHKQFVIVSRLGLVIGLYVMLISYLIIGTTIPLGPTPVARI